MSSPREKKINLKLIRSVALKIANGVRPENIFLFGSYAYGKPCADSDVDLLIIMKTQKRPIERTVEVLKKLKIHPFPMDILVRTPSEIHHRIKIGDSFFKEIMEKGKILYDARTEPRVAY